VTPQGQRRATILGKALAPAWYLDEMLTRLEVDGFKNLLDFAADFGPYTCIAGPNAVGKSNVFDAIEFLSLLADKPFMEAAALVRSVGGRPADPSALFWGTPERLRRQMVLAAEMIVPREVEDDFGRPAEPTASYLRYEVCLEYRSPLPGDPSQLGKIVLVHEKLDCIKPGDAVQKLPWSRSKKEFRDAVVFNKRTVPAYISTTETDGAGTVNVHQDGGSRGRPRQSPAARAPRTVVSTTTTADDPTILAVRREMQQWRILSLEPSAMRQPDSITAPASVTPNGAHLAAALYRMKTVDADACEQVAAAAAALVDVREVCVDYDPAREVLTLQARIGAGPLLPARNLSDGTLRFVALCVIAQDSQLGGLVCMEEPENGIHPARVGAMVQLVQDLAVDPAERPGPDNPFRQVIVNTHSPAFVQHQRSDDIVFATQASVRRDGGIGSSVRLLPLVGTWRARPGCVRVEKIDVEDYLLSARDGQLQLELGIAG